MATGGELIIDDSLFKSIERLDRSLKSLKKTSEDLDSGVITWLKKLQGTSITSFTRELEETIKQHQKLSQALSGRSGFETFVSQSNEAAKALLTLLNAIRSTNEAKKEFASNKEMAQSKDAEDAIRRYRELADEIKKLREIQKDAREFAYSPDKELSKDARQAYIESTKQIKSMLAEQSDIERKYADEVAQYKRDANMREFREKAQLAREAANAVEKEIERELEAREKALIKQINLEQKYSVRMDKMRELATSFEERVNKSVSDEERRENEEYLKELNRRIAEEQKYVERMRNLKEMAAKVDADALKQYEEDLKKTQEAHERTIAENAKFLQEYELRMEKLERMRQQIEERNKKRQRNIDNKYGDSSKGALNYYNRLYSDKGVLSIQKMEIALSKLRDAQKRLNLNTEEGKKRYDELGRAISDLNTRMVGLTTSRNTSNAEDAIRRYRNESKKTIGVIDEMQRRIALLFSVDSTMRYVNKLVNVRKEFEKQQKSLEIILRSKDEADKLWQQTIDLAVKSPFRVKELVTYTKQLAAYRIETSKLHDTTKMLADVSAGLGVDMNRLILAYGQVRAAEYLRGTELRQFTEAGIPLLDELAKHFSALEGRAISTADVFEMISKRMVTFSDVSQVFERMTSEGGVFYEMQEKQAETLHGQLNNLRDSLDLMMNTIGKESEGTILSMIRFAREAAENWREIAVRIKDVGSVLLAFKGVSLIANAAFAKGMQMNKMSILGFGIALNRLKFDQFLANASIAEIRALGFSRSTAMLQKSLSALKVAAIGAGQALLSFAPAAILYAVYELYMHLTKASREAERLKKELQELVTTDVGNLEKSIEMYKNLYTRIDMVNKGSDAHLDIIEKLNSGYGEYLDYLVTEETTMEQLAQSYDDVVSKMQEKQALASFEKGLDTIAESYGKSLRDAKEDFYDLFSGASIKKNNGLGIVPTKKEIDDIFAIIQQRAKNLDAEYIDSLKEQSDLIQDVVRKYYGEDFFLSRDFSQSISLLDILVKKKQQEKELQEEINAQYKKVLHSRKAQLEMERLQNEYAVKRNEIKKEYSGFEEEKELEKAKDEFELKEIDIKVKYNLIGDQEEKEARDKILNWAKGTILEINNQIKSELGSVFSEEELSNVLFSRDMVENKTIGNHIKDISAKWKEQNEIIAEQISLKSALGSLDETQENILKNAIRKEELYRKSAEILGVELDYTKRLSEEARHAINALLPEQYQISLEQAYGGIDKIISHLKQEETKHLNIIEQINERKKEGLPFNEQELKDAEDAYWWTKKRLDLIDPNAKTAISEKKVDFINSKLEEKYQIDSIDRTKDEVTLLADANSERQKAIEDEKRLNAQKEKGHEITKQQLIDAENAVKQTTLRWELLGGKEEEKTTGGKARSNSLYDERIKVIDDLNKKYRELDKTLEKSEALQGAFDAYIDAFAEAYKDIKWIPSNVKKMTPQEFAEKVLNFPDENALVAFLDKLADEPMKAFEKIKVELAKGNYVYDIKVKTKAEADKSLIDSIESMFGNYEVSLEMEKLNIPPDLAQRLFGVESIDLSSIRSKIEEEIAKIGTDKGQEDLLKQLQDLLKKVDKLDKDALEERMKRYTEFLKKGQTGRVKIKIEELRDLAKLEEDYQKNKIGAADYSLAKKGIQDEAEKKLQSLEWDEFKESDTYIRMFEDLDYASRKSIEAIIERLKEMRENLKELSPTEIKEITNAIERLEDAAANKNPFASLVASIKPFVKYLRERKKLEEEYQGSREKELLLEQRYNDAQDFASQAQVEYEAISKNKDATEEQKIAAKATAEFSKQQQLNAKANLDTQKGITSELEKQKAEGEKAQSKFMTSMGEVAGYAEQAFSALPEVAANLENVFGSMSNKTKDIVDSISAIGGGLASMAGNIASGDYIGALVDLTKVVGEFFKIGDKRREREIQRELKAVEKLQREYDKLKDSLDKAYTTTDIKHSFDEANANLQKQIDSYDKIIAAEEGKKKTDNEKLEQYRQEQEELIKQQEELLHEQVESFGGNYDFRSVAREFVDAWLDAFNETGKGMDGLEENFKEMMHNIVAEQAAAGGVAKLLEPLMNEINSALEGDFKVDEAELANIEGKSEEALKFIDDYLQSLFGEGGIYENYRNSATETGELSGLQRGIQGITEETAQIIEANLNAIRMTVVDNGSKMSSVISSLESISNSISNTMVGYLKTVAEQTSAINSLLEGVRTSNTQAIRVELVN